MRISITGTLTASLNIWRRVGSGNQAPNYKQPASQLKVDFCIGGVARLAAR